MRFLLALIALVLLLAAAFAAFAPATLVEREIAQRASDRVHLTGAEGTIWAGRGELTVTGSDIRLPIAWRIDVPASLAHGELRGSLSTEPGAAQSARFELGRDHIRVEELELALPAADILRASKASLPLRTGGVVRLRVTSFDSDRTTANVDAIADWENAELAGPGSDLRLALGTVHAAFAGGGSEIPGSLQNQGGDVQIAGSMRWPVRGAPSVDLTVTPRPGLEPDRAANLNALLGMVARPDGGTYRLTWSAAR
jgi:hypothetical protein